jgi:hypothetical protein
MSFKKNGYQLIKGAISKELADFCYQYFLNKRAVAKYLFDEKYISPFTEYFGVWNDSQIPETYSHYADIVMETLLQQVKPIMEKKSEIKLIETYSYARIYKKGDELKKHKDRYSCEISTTMNLGGDDWPIFLEPDIKVHLKPGDMLMYRGCELEHWREPFTGENCGQVFLHYNDASGKDAQKNKFDGRSIIGLPSYFKT